MLSCKALVVMNLPGTVQVMLGRRRTFRQSCSATTRNTLPSSSVGSCSCGTAPSALLSRASVSMASPALWPRRCGGTSWSVRSQTAPTPGSSLWHTPFCPKLFLPVDYTAYLTLGSAPGRNRTFLSKSQSSSLVLGVGPASDVGAVVEG